MVTDTARTLKDAAPGAPPPGLSPEQVRQSREEFGPNSLAEKKRKSFFRSFLESFGDPIIKVLLVALAVNIIFLFHQAEWFDTLGIAIAILLATLISTISEYGSESAFEKLRQEAARLKARVRRGGRTAELPVEELVVGDIVLLGAGERVPADGRLIEGKLDVDQSALNGESKEAHKFPRAARAGEDAEDFLDAGRLFSGTVVCGGEGVMRVAAVGGATVYGRLADEVREETRESPLKLRLAALAKTISRFGYVCAALVALAYLFNALILENNFDPARIAEAARLPGYLFGVVLQAITLGVTVIVMAVPEGLPMMITVVLSSNMKRMLKAGVLVRKLVGIETAGSLNILFTDKTGTLTRGRLEVTHVIAGDGSVLTASAAAKQTSERVKLLGDSLIWNAGAEMSGGRAVGGNATDRAVVAFASALPKSGYVLRKGKSIPFSSESKFMATEVAGERRCVFIKGAPELILAQCTQIVTENGGAEPFFHKEKVRKAAAELAKDAVRVVAVAVADRLVEDASAFRNLALVALLGIRDDVRPEAVKGVRQVQRAGIQAVMITGDAPETALAIARKCGIANHPEDLCLTSEKLRRMGDEALKRALPNLRVVARALPSDKSRLVRLAQELGLVVGMTGDGVNDAPALKRADVGFAMGSGTEVAKEASDIVILDDNFHSIARSVCYGRTIFKSIRKFIIFQMTVNLCAVAVSVVGPFLGLDSPITVIQMLWINIVMDTLAGLAFGGEQARDSYMDEAPKRRDEPIINRYMWGQIALSSAFAAALCLFFLKRQPLRLASGDTAYLMTAFFALLMFCAIFLSFCARTHKINLLDHLASNRRFLQIMGLVAAVQIAMIYLGGPLFRTVGLHPLDLLRVVALAALVIPADMLRKFVVRKLGMESGT